MDRQKHRDKDQACSHSWRRAKVRPRVGVMGGVVLLEESHPVVNGAVNDVLSQRPQRCTGEH